MRAILAAALALALAGAPLAAQARHKATRAQPERARRPTSTTAAAKPASTAAARLRLWENGAILLATRLERKQDSTPEHLRSDVNGLGRDLADARSALAQLQREALPADRPRLDSVRAHFEQARKHYSELYKAQPNPDAIASHAALVHQQLVAAQNAMIARGTPARSTRRRRTVRSRRSGR